MLAFSFGSGAYFNKGRHFQLARCGSCWCRNIDESGAQTFYRGYAVFYGCKFLVTQRNGLLQPEQVHFSFYELGFTRGFRSVEGALSTSHSVWALGEEIVGAVTMSEIIVHPRSASCRPGLDYVAVNQHLYRPQITLEVSGVCVRLG